MTTEKSSSPEPASSMAESFSTSDSLAKLVPAKDELSVPPPANVKFRRDSEPDRKMSVKRSKAIEHAKAVRLLSIQSENERNSRRDQAKQMKFKRKVFFIATTQILVGSCLLALNVVTITAPALQKVHPTLGFDGTGILAGIFTAAAGCIGWWWWWATYYKSTTCNKLTYVGLSLTGALFAGACFVAYGARTPTAIHLALEYIDEDYERQMCPYLRHMDARTVFYDAASNITEDSVYDRHWRAHHPVQKRGNAVPLAICILALILSLTSFMISVVLTVLMWRKSPGWRKHLRFCCFPPADRQLKVPKNSTATCYNLVAATIPDSADPGPKKLSNGIHAEDIEENLRRKCSKSTFERLLAPPQES